jgi:hypothetical protein
MSIVLIISSIVLSLGIISFILSFYLEHLEAPLLAMGIIASVGSIAIGFGTIGATCPIRTEEVILQPNSNYMSRAQNALFINIEGQTLYDDKHAVVTAPLENIRVKKEKGFNSYGIEIETKYCVVIK